VKVFLKDTHRLHQIKDTLINEEEHTHTHNEGLTNQDNAPESRPSPRQNNTHGSSL